MIIVFGNIKGGNGKSTLAVHTAVDLMYRGFPVISIDCDGGQGTLSRYWENRTTFKTLVQSKYPGGIKGQRHIPLPLQTLRFSPKTDTPLHIQGALDGIYSENPQAWIIMDTAGYDSDISRYAHGLADILITPMNDSAIDLDLLVNVNDTQKIGKLPLSHYALLVWEQRMRKASQHGGSLDWMIVRNRMHTLSSRNQQNLTAILTSLSSRIGFHLAPTVAERVIFRELFAYGLTILDHENLPPSHESAYKEIQNITNFLLRFIQKNRTIAPFN